MTFLDLNDFKKGKELSLKLHELIPGGAHTYSKGDDQFPSISPKVISHGRGSKVWDVDGHEFLDFAMGLTSVSLGHAYEPILQAVRSELEKGLNFQRPSYIELEFAEQLKTLLPKMDMFKFAKNGSTVTSAAVKLARAYTNRDLIGVCKEQPFFSYDDWFIGSTVCSRGIPDDIKRLTFQFPFNNIEGTRNIFETLRGKVAAIILEPIKFDPPEKNYFFNLRKLCDEFGVVLIVDEMVTGFKFGLPGAINCFREIGDIPAMEPDLLAYGKGIANGFSVAVLAGRKEIMELGGIRNKGEEKVFLVSTTHGAETHAIRAAMATIDVFNKHQVIDFIWKMGNQLRQILNEEIARSNLENFIQVIGFDCFLALVFKGSNGKIESDFKTFFLQEIIRRGVLTQGTFTISFSHSQKDFDFFRQVFKAACIEYRKAIDRGSVSGLLVGEPAQPVFRKFL